MASTCPNCGKKLHMWNVKAECAQCGVSIPNYNWEARLDEDNVKAENSFETFYRTLNRIMYSLWGTKLRIARLVLTVLPAIGFILPWATIKSAGNSFDLSVISLSGNRAFIDFISGFFGNAGLYITNMKLEGFSGPVTFGLIAYFAFLLSLLLIVIAFFTVLIKCKKPNTTTPVIFDVLSILASVASVVCFVIAGTKAEAVGAFNFGSFGAIGASGSISWGYFVALALLLVAMGINIAVIKAKAKTDEQLEDERLARKAAKDEKERINAEKRETANAEAEKKAAQEQAEIVAKAKADLEKRETKKNSKK